MSNLKAGIFLLLGILLVTGTASLIVFLNERKEEAVRGQLEAAGRALDEGDLDAAVAAWEAVLQKDPDHPEAALALFDTVLWFDRDRAGKLMDRLEAMPLDPERVLFRKVRLALLEGDLETARAAVEELERHQPLQLEGRLATLLLRIAEEDGEAALPLLGELALTWPANRHLRLLISGIRSLQPSLIDRVNAKDGLMRLMERTDEFSFRAAFTLVLGDGLPLYPEDRAAALAHLRTHPWSEKGMAQLTEPIRTALTAALEGTAPPLDLEAVLTADDTEENYAVLRRIADERFGELAEDEQARLLERLRGHERADLGTRLRATQLLMRLQPERRMALLDEATPDDAAEFLIFGRWLLEIGEAGSALEVSGKLDFREDVDALSLRFDALMALERLDDAEALLEAGGAALAEWQTAFLRTNIAIMGKDFEAAGRLLETLVDEAPNGPVLLNVAKLAGEAGAPGLQRRAYDRAWEAGLVFPQPRAMEYLGMFLEDADLDTALRFAAYCRTLRPKEPVYINNHSYLQVVAGRGIDAAIGDMRELVDKHPKFPPFRLTLAMAELIGGYPGKARETLDSMGESPGLEDARSKLSMALVLAGNGEHDKAGELIDSIELASLMAAEQDLVNLYMRDGTF